jgi:hypothetical protein
MPADDVRRRLLRFQGDKLDHTLGLVTRLVEMASGSMTAVMAAAIATVT